MGSKDPGLSTVRPSCQETFMYMKNEQDCPPDLKYCGGEMKQNILDLRIEKWPIEKLVPYARNARSHSNGQVAQVAASIAQFGFVNPILVGPDRVIIAG